MFKTLAFFMARNKKFSWWWFGLKIGVFAALVVWWWLEEQNKRQLQDIGGQLVPDNDQSIPLPVEETSGMRTKQVEKLDDLTKIKGIGPKINAVLQQAGINTFAQLANLEPVEIKQIIVDAGVRLSDPATWPEQAALAARGDWDALVEF